MKLIALFFLLFGVAANACPNLNGDYLCAVIGGNAHYLIGQSTDANVTTYSITFAATLKDTYIADGLSRSAQSDLYEQVNGVPVQKVGISIETNTAKCSGDSFLIDTAWERKYFSGEDDLATFQTEYALDSSGSLNKKDRTAEFKNWNKDYDNEENIVCKKTNLITAP